MHPSEVTSPAATPTGNQKWWHEMTGYHWFVFVVAALGWLADCMDQQLFNLARKQAVTDLLGPLSPTDPSPGNFATYATSIFLIGWALGGLTFGVMGDRLGRVKTMLLTILIYSVFTGLSALSFSVWDFMLYRFLTGLGVGGEFAVGVALLAEVMPDRARPHALGLLQALSAIGNCTAAGLFILLGWMVQNDSLNITLFGHQVSPWRVMFLFGLAPAVLALLVRRRLKGPERWKQAVASGDVKKAGSYRELFGDPRWRKNAIVGLCLAFAGVVGLWGIGFFSIDLVQSIFNERFKNEGLSANELKGQGMIWGGITSLMLNIGAFFGIYAFSRVTHYTGRKPAFAIGFLLAMGSTAYVFWALKSFSDIFWMLPIMGFCQLSVFGGYAIYFPELFPTRLRSTGTSFCYNVGRFVAASGPLGLGLLTSQVFAYSAVSTGDLTMPRRLAGVAMCGVFLLGLLALPFAPETRGKPLPE